MINVFEGNLKAVLTNLLTLFMVVWHSGFQERPAIGHSAYVIHTGRPHIT